MFEFVMMILVAISCFSGMIAVGYIIYLLWGLAQYHKNK